MAFTFLNKNGRASRVSKLIFQVYLTVSSKFSEQAVLLDTDLISNSDFQRSFLGFFFTYSNYFLKTGLDFLTQDTSRTRRHFCVHVCPVSNTKTAHDFAKLVRN